MPTLRRIAPRNVVTSRHRRVFGAAFVSLTLLFTSVAVTGNVSWAASDDAPAAADVAVAGLFSPAARVVADGREVAATTTARMAEAAIPPPPPPVHCPVPTAEFIDSWGFTRSGGRRHKGVDMMAPHGTPVLAPVSGTIRHSNSALGGLGFYLDDAEGNTYFGSHLASLGPTGWVEAGTRIGTVGSTGNASATAPALRGHAGRPWLGEPVSLRRGVVRPHRRRPGRLIAPSAGALVPRARFHARS